MLGSKQELWLPCHWQPDALTTWLDLIHTWLDLIRDCCIARKGWRRSRRRGRIHNISQVSQEFKEIKEIVKRWRVRERDKMALWIGYKAFRLVPSQAHGVRYLLRRADLRTPDVWGGVRHPVPNTPPPPPRMLFYYHSQMKQNEEFNLWQKSIRTSRTILWTRNGEIYLPVRAREGILFGESSLYKGRSPSPPPFPGTP